jgi:anthranilate synthase component 1
LVSVAPTVRSFSAAFEPLHLVERYPGRYPGFLESASDPLVNRAGRFDILPIASGEVLQLTAKSLSGPYAVSGGFLEALDRWWRSLRTPRGHAAESEIPFDGGWLLYLGYELAAEIEPVLKLPAGPHPYIALAIRTPAAWIRDRTHGASYLVAEPGAEGLLAQFAADAQESGTRSLPPAPLNIEEEDSAVFLAAVRRALQYTAAGDVYQTNLSRQWRGRAASAINPVDLYRRLRSANPSPFAALLRYGDVSILSSSPERLLALRGGRAATRPIAGTRPRGATQAEDDALVSALLANEKERAEHVMLIDLERNDLGRVCEGGSVAVDEYMSVESYAHVHHIVSNVSGTLRAEATPVDAIRALFPGGTITGCPKVRCMQIIAELEGSGRGAYTGSIGYLSRNGDCDLNILIRTIAVHGAELCFRTGAGIVADSIPAQELAETRAKALGLLRAVDAAS